MVRIQLGLYHLALGYRQQAIDALQKALTINTDDIPATVHLSRIYVTPSRSSHQRQQQPLPLPQNIASDQFLPSAAKSKPKPPNSMSTALNVQDPDRDNVDLAAGLLSHLTDGTYLKRGTFWRRHMECREEKRKRQKHWRLHYVYLKEEV